MLFSRSTLTDAKVWSDRVLHSADIQRVTYAFEANLRTAESVQRGYILTRDSSYLDRLALELQSGKDNLDSLLALTSDNHIQTKRLMELQSVLQARSMSITRGLEIAGGSLEEVTAFLKEGQGKEEMIHIDSILQSVRAEEARLQTERYHELTDSRDSTQWLLLVVLIVGLTVLGAVYFAFRFDITKRLHAENKLDEVIAELRQSNVSLVSSNKELESFASIASHDLQEPLRKIQSFSDLLKVRHEAELSPGALQLLEKMSGAAKRMRQLIDNLLTYSRFSKAAQEIKPTDMNECVSRVLSDLDVRIASSGAQINVGKLPTIQADRFQLEQLFLNLLSNALKFSEEGRPTIIAIEQVDSSRLPAEVSQSITQPSYVISVKDNGIGLDEAYSEKIFGMFQRLHSKAQYEGTGIGLAICKKIVERHNGTITVLSKLGEGSEFLLTFPR